MDKFTRIPFPLMFVPLSFFISFDCGNTDCLLQEGNVIPDISGITADGTRISLREFVAQQHVVLYFYPKDDTPGCTKEACSLRDSFELIREAGADVLGVSTDDTVTHKAFAEKYTLPFHLIADTDHAFANAFGVPITFRLAKRVTFILGKDGTIKKVYPNVDVTSHTASVLAYLNALR